jgi:hypothetical protein
MMACQLEENSMRVIQESMLQEETLASQSYETMHRRQLNMNMLVKDVLALNPMSSRMSQASVKERSSIQPSVYLQQEEVFFDPIQENEVINNLAPSKEIVLNEDSDHE